MEHFPDATPPLPVTDELESAWHEQPTFEGTAREYFVIWVRNAILTLVTFGIYLPWARVNTRRYLYSRTRLAGHHFGYHADPKRMLPAYLAIAISATVYVVALNLEPLVAVAMFMVGAVALPWLVQMSLRFSMANTSYRGHRFRFRGGTGGAYAAYMIRPVFLTILTLGLAAPWAEKKRREYFFDNVALGNLESRADLQTGFFYIVVIFGGVVMSLLAVLGSMVAAPFFMDMTSGSASPPPSWVMELASWLPYLIGFAYGAFVNALFVDHCWDCTSIAAADESSDLRMTLHSRLDTFEYVWIVATNAILAAVSLGLLIPYGVVRLQRFRVSKVSVSGHGNLDDITSSPTDDPMAIGEGATEIYGVELGI